MTEQERKIVEDLLDAVKKSVDSSVGFNDQVKEIRNKLLQSLNILCPGIDSSDPEIETMIKEAVVIVENKPIVFEKGYTPWLADVKPTISWDYYNRYEKYLVKVKKWNWGTISSISESTDVILDHMHNPKTEAFFGTKGLVMGDIQSGKTANYTALINKALDCGYKLIIVLAGLTKDLRSQTQKRLDREVLGYETRPNSQKGNSIGVGLVDTKMLSINAVTNADDSGDLNKATAERFSTTLADGMTPLIAVLKKNSTVLTALIENVLSSKQGAKTNDKFDVPVLIIDDEVDQASVNTKKAETIKEASSINKLIRTMLSKFNRFAYVGYTATPFANVFINPYGFEKEEDKDIFPEDFIICLPRPQKYCGVKEYFGINTLDDEEDDDALTLDLYQKIDDYYDLFDDETKAKKKVKVDTPVIKINESLHNAFMHFIISSAVKYSRGIIEHNSMLIHIARFKNPATSMRDLVKDELSEMLHAYKYGPKSEKDKYYQFWMKNIKPISQKRLVGDFKDEWKNIEPHITTLFEMSLNGIKIVNGDSGDVCDYDSNTVGQHIIIGGDKLSRGLTLEGLIVSYYYRKSNTYDALLQMGRWFGYRNGWIDLCRIYTIKDFVNAFINAGIATEMFKKDISDMNNLQLTPVEFGLKVKYSPKLAPTSRSKMRSAVKQKISFSDSLQQVLNFDKKYIDNNRKVTENFINRLSGEIRKNGNVVFNNVKPADLIDYLSDYHECDEIVGTVSVKNWVNYIEKLNKNNELIDWTIILHSNSSKDESALDTISGYNIYKSQYAERNLESSDDNPSLFIKAIVDQSDFRDFFAEDSKEYEIVKKYTKNDPTIRKFFSPKHGVLSIYSMDIHKKVFKEEVTLPNGNKRKIYEKGDVLKGATGVIGLCVWFPNSSDFENSAIDYYLSAVYQKLEKEEEEDDEE